MLTVADVVEGIAGWRPEGEVFATPITRAVIDSRQAQPGALFIALRGEHKDGHDFVGDAFRRGAVAAIVEARIWRVETGRWKMEDECWMLDTRFPLSSSSSLPVSQFSNFPEEQKPVCIVVENSLKALQDAAAWWRGRFDVRVVGVTGSVGKTTTKEMVAAVLAQRFRTLKSEESFNNEIGLPLTLLHLRPEHERVVLEMGGAYQMGEIAWLAQIARPVIGVVTNVEPVHLERMGTIERIAETKTELVEALPPDGVAVLNHDDHRVRAMAERTQARVFFYGLSSECDLWADEIESLGLEGIRFRFHYGDEVVHAKVPLLGRHSVHTALRAAAVGLIEGLDWQDIMDGLRGAAQLRLVVVSGIRDSIVLDDTYNSSPPSAIAALNLLAELEGRKIAVLGDMLELGSYEEEGHRKVGRRVVDVAAVLITVGQRGRMIGEEALASGMDPAAVHMVDDNPAAVRILEDILQPGDVVLVKGSRGMRMEEIVGAITAPGSSA